MKTINVYLNCDDANDYLVLTLDEFFTRCTCWNNGRSLSPMDRVNIIRTGEVGTVGSNSKMRVRWLTNYNWNK